MPVALFLHHDANSLTGLVGAIVAELGYEVREHYICTELDSGVSSGPLPTLDGVDLLVPLGSRWSVYDHENIGTWIGDEQELVREADRRGIPVLGICFGGQLLASAHGAEVRPAATEEIGWIEIDPAPLPDGGIVDLPFATGPWFQWHLDVFAVPEGATLLATSPAGPQAFRLRRNLALQFHPEIDTAVLEEWMITDRDQLRDCGVDPDELLERTAAETEKAHTRAEALVRAFLSEVG
ncbi:MAG: gamma-glutamyl-gamma-aminobutyrate hydrolase family protein [Acidimicrobiales bacterium]